MSDSPSSSPARTPTQTIGVPINRFSQKAGEILVEIKTAISAVEFAGLVPVGIVLSSESHREIAIAFDEGEPPFTRHANMDTLHGLPVTERGMDYAFTVEVRTLQ